MKNRLIITMGDPCGVGPEIIVKFFNDFINIANNDYIPAVVGSRSILEYYMEELGLKLPINELSLDLTDDYNNLDLTKINLFNIDEKIENFNLGNHTKIGGELSIKYLDLAIELCQKGLFDGIVTAPISKDSINMAGHKFSGHTTYLANKTDTEDYAMILKGNRITVILNTTHLSILDAAKKVKKDSILKKIKMAQRAKKELSLHGPIAVAGLNPHNGENGLFGDEESKEIEPAVMEAKNMGIDCEGPIVPDTLFVKMLQHKYSMAVVMYHDQGLIPMKMDSFGEGVNITIGLPFVRTSVDHGTAFDIVGKNMANTGSFKEAINLANININNRNN